MSEVSKETLDAFKEFEFEYCYEGLINNDEKNGWLHGYKYAEKRTKAVEAQNAELRAALANVRDDIGRTAPEVIWRGEQPETTFDYITNIIGDELTYDQWVAKEPS